MHLHREHLLRVEKFQQQGESLKAPVQLSHQVFLRLRHHLTDSLAMERSIGNLARVIAAIAEEPSFADRTIARERRG
jgi:hypothetical protein